MLGTISLDFIKRTGQRSAICALVVLGAGCAGNHAFVRGADLDVPVLVSELEALEEEDEALYKITYVPLAHVDAQFFAKNDDTSNYPEGNAYVSLRSWLPLFGIVDADIELFDAENAAYEKLQIFSFLWGVWTREVTTLETSHGARTERKDTLLWLLDSGPRVHYDTAEED